MLACKNAALCSSRSWQEWQPGWPEGVPAEMGEALPPPTGKERAYVKAQDRLQFGLAGDDLLICDAHQKEGARDCTLHL